MDAISESIHSRCYDLLCKFRRRTIRRSSQPISSPSDQDRYEALVTQLNSNGQPMIVLYYADLNVNDQLLAILQSL